MCNIEDIEFVLIVGDIVVEFDCLEHLNCYIKFELNI